MQECHLTMHVTILIQKMSDQELRAFLIQNINSSSPLITILRLLYCTAFEEKSNVEHFPTLPN